MCHLHDNVVQSAIRIFNLHFLALFTHAHVLQMEHFHNVVICTCMHTYKSCVQTFTYVYMTEMFCLQNGYSVSHDN